MDDLEPRVTPDSVTVGRYIDADGDGQPDMLPEPARPVLGPLAPYAKALAAFVTPAVTLAIGFVAAPSDGGTAVTASEWLTMAAACLATAGFVYAVPNKAVAP